MVPVKSRDVPRTAIAADVIPASLSEWAVLDFSCHVGHPQGIFYLWRPMLSDPKDDMVLELAVAAGCDRIVTHNVRDFAGSESFGVGVATPREFLASLETSS